MRVIYARPILEQIEEAIINARGDGKRIDHIILTMDEWTSFCFSHKTFTGVSEYIYKGTRIIREGGIFDVKCK